MSDSLDSTTKVCHQCQLEKPIYEFHRHVREKDGYRRICKQCRAQKEGFRYVKPAPPGYQWCRKCDTLYPASLEHFYWNSSKSRLYASCKTCHYARTRNWQKANLEFWYSLNRQWALLHPDKKSEGWQKWKVNHPEVYAANLARHKVTVKIWNSNNPERVKSTKKKAKAKRRALLANAPGFHTAADIRQLYEDQEGLCGYCGIRLPNNYHLDHMQPLSRGGSNWPDNLCLTCPDCNLSKSSKTVDEWVSVRGW